MAKQQIRDMKTSIVIVGIENSKLVGKCPGSELDAKNMLGILKDYSSDISFLLNENATKNNVKSSLEKAIESDLAIFYYSGHGGSQKFSDTGPEEVDGKDEFLCLYDGYLRDNDIWSIISKSKGRVFMVFDCCHSQTMFQISGPTIEKHMLFGSSGNQDDDFSMMVWSGCPDDSVSYGSPSGGQLTNTILKYHDKKLTYGEMWSKIRQDSNLKRFEKVQMTFLGRNFENDPVFR